MKSWVSFRFSGRIFQSYFVKVRFSLLQSSAFGTQLPWLQRPQEGGREGRRGKARRCRNARSDPQNSKVLAFVRGLLLASRASYDTFGM